MTSTIDPLFAPLKVGNLHLPHRTIMAPLTRHRASDAHVPLLPMVADYYSQRASLPGTLLITEATAVSPRAGGQANVPGIWSREQVEAWREVTEAVHARGCFIFVQLWALGRRADGGILRTAEGGPYDVVCPSAVVLREGEGVPREMSEGDIEGVVDDFARAARNAVEAGFDGVEIHGANGYLVDQFLQDVCNRRDDGWGGSIEKRARFAVEVTRAVVDDVGDSGKVAVRLSPWSDFEGVRMGDCVPQFRCVVSQLAGMGLAYLHLVESRISGDVASAVYLKGTERNDVFVEEWGRRGGGPVLMAGGFTPESARKAIERYALKGQEVGVAFGRYFISTPDLPFRMREGMELNRYDRSTFYKVMSADGYTDYPASEAYKKLVASL